MNGSTLRLPPVESPVMSFLN